jgi:hypothetical protein
MKFRFLLWMLGRLMNKASRDNPAFQQQLLDRDMVFQLHTLDARLPVTSSSKTNALPASAARPTSQHLPWVLKMRPMVSPP